MAEFQEVCKQWRRMCEKNHTDCMRLCPICTNSTCGELSEADDDDIRKAEYAIMAWAAENPEPVYELWGEWFEKRGDLIRGWHNATNIQWIAKTFGRLMCKPIPADIAEKLGIKPKEDV